MDKVAAVRLAGHFENHFIHIRIRLLTRQPVDLCTRPTRRATPVWDLSCPTAYSKS